MMQAKTFDIPTVSVIIDYIIVNSNVPVSIARSKGLLAG